MRNGVTFWLTNLRYHHPAVGNQREVFITVVSKSHRVFRSHPFYNVLSASHDAVLVHFLVKVMALGVVLGDQGHLGPVLHSLHS